MRLNISVSSNRPHPPQFTLCLTHLIATLAHNLGPFTDMGLQIKQNVSLLPAGRQNSVAASIKAGFTHILFIDDDSAFPPNALHRLAAHGKRIVAANFVKKVREAHYCATALDGQPMASMGKGGLEEASKIGFGMTLIDLDVFVKTPAPHFEIRWNGETYTGEDHCFSNKVRERGEQLWIDHDLSAICGHIGDYVYSGDPAFNGYMA